MTCHGSDLREVTGCQPGFGSSSWSPGGRWILTDNGEGRLYVVHSDGTGRHPIQLHTGPDRHLEFQPSWSPNDNAIVFSLFLASSGQVDIFTARADGTDLRQVTNMPDGEEFADWGTHSD